MGQEKSAKDRAVKAFKVAKDLWRKHGWMGSSATLCASGVGIYTFTGYPLTGAFVFAAGTFNWAIKAIKRDQADNKPMEVKASQDLVIKRRLG